MKRGSGAGENKDVNQRNKRALPMVTRRLVSPALSQTDAQISR